MRDGRLPRTDEKQLSTKLLAARLYYLLQVLEAVRAWSDVLLNLVDHDQCQGEFSITLESIAKNVDHVPG
ncbi:MAG: hypothetical protein BWY92_00635 [Firmicutes bacterium ADurb.BinA052]|nr:MAG: hypothetical protein BWY92_00635 [Firmicutes bacterium ADurb.BinA052]